MTSHLDCLDKMTVLYSNIAYIMGCWCRGCPFWNRHVHRYLCYCWCAPGTVYFWLICSNFIESYDLYTFENWKNTSNLVICPCLTHKGCLCCYFVFWSQFMINSHADYVKRADVLYHTLYRGCLCVFTLIPRSFGQFHAEKDWSLILSRKYLHKGETQFKILILKTKAVYDIRIYAKPDKRSFCLDNVKVILVRDKLVLWTRTHLP